VAGSKVGRNPAIFTSKNELVGGSVWNVLVPLAKVCGPIDSWATRSKLAVVCFGDAPFCGERFPHDERTRDVSLLRDSGPLSPSACVS